MGIVDKTKHLLDGRSEQKSYEYLCRDCGHVFDSAESMLARLDCPECGSDDVRDHIV